MEIGDRVSLTVGGLQSLLDALSRQGRRVLGPVVRDGAIVYDDIGSLDDLPRGMTDDQQAARYQLRRRDDDALFGYAVGPQSWKKYLHPPIQRLWRAMRVGGDVRIEPAPVATEKLAFLGVRACELHAIAIQDRVFLEGAYVDPHYRARRAGALLIAVNCGVAGATCFCVSMGTGPAASGGYDLALTELDDRRFLLQIGSEAGRDVLADVPVGPATAAQIEEVSALVAQTARSMGRAMPDVDLHALLASRPEHPRWDDVAARCLSCANCTMVCPTCFCTTVEEASDLAGVETSRSRRWDSCFAMDFSYIHGGAVRKSGASRYRQWMTHKLATWFDQFGTSGCVGCGRCITWCPVGIDITEEARAICADGQYGEVSHGDA